MKKKDFLFALLVIIIWGANFTVIKLGLGGVPSMLLVAMRYALVAFPAIFFIKKPKIEWKYIIYYGLTVGVGQFACLFYALEIGMPAGLASITSQLQAFISPILGSIFLKEKLKPRQILGFLIAGLGLMIIGFASTSKDVAIPIGALSLAILSPVFWATSNIVSRLASEKANANGEKLDMLSFIVWSSLIPPIPMIGLALIIDSPATLIASLMNLKFISIFSALYLAFAATLFGYGYWNYLISKYSIGKITPLSLLVPITGLFTARIVLGERLSSLQWLGVSIILIGLITANFNLKDIFKNRFILKKQP